MTRRSMVGGLSILVLSVAMGCARPPSREAPSREVARADLLQIMEGFNRRDYQLFSAEWSQGMKNMISEQAFLDFQSKASAATGAFVELEALEPYTSTKRTDLNAWMATCRFEKTTTRVLFGYTKSAGEIDALVFDPPQQ